MTEELKNRLDAAAKQVDSFIARLFPREMHQELHKASTHLLYAGGKRIRPFLVLASCELVGGNPEVAVPFAAAIELVHNFTLIHDDIIDRDKLRRGVATVHTLYGTPMAILAGDTLFAKAFESLMAAAGSVPPKRLLKAVDVMTKATIKVCEGQAMDMEFAHRLKVSEREYLMMIGKKTAALMVAASEMGAIVGGGTPLKVNRLRKAMEAAGLAFQMVDDILGLSADEQKLGKPVGSDIREGKRTLITIYGLNHAGRAERELIFRALGNSDATQEEIREAVDVLTRLGAINYVSLRAEAYRQKAKNELKKFSPSPVRESLLALVDYIVARDR
ncbi:MAG: polyprenyl synthetase family protein [Nitrososphaerota archaeon]